MNLIPIFDAITGCFKAEWLNGDLFVMKSVSNKKNGEEHIIVFPEFHGSTYRSSGSAIVIAILSKWIDWNK